MLFLKIFLFIALIASIIWAVADPGYDSISSIIIIVGSLLAIRVNERAQKDKRNYEP
jgi:hypothetical protein